MGSSCFLVVNNETDAIHQTQDTGLQNKDGAAIVICLDDYYFGFNRKRGGEVAVKKSTANDSINIRNPALASACRFSPGAHATTIN